MLTIVDDSSCTLCRRRKLRCNRETPCSNCLRSRNGICIYDNSPSPRQEKRPGNEYPTPTDTPPNISTASTVACLQPRSSDVKSSAAPAPASQSSTQEIESLKRKVGELEEQLSKGTQDCARPLFLTPTANTSTETTTSRIGGQIIFHHESGVSGQPRAITHSVTHKNRLFGQSHWINGCALV